VAINAAGLDYTAVPNEHGRVDILTAGATAFDTGAGVLRNLYLGVDAGGNPHVYTSYTFDITSTVGGAGGTFQLRFAEADNQGNFNMGVDDVSITFGTCAHHTVHGHVDTNAPNHTGNQDVHHGQHGHTVDPSQADCGHAPAGHHLLTADSGEGLFSAGAHAEPTTFVAGLNEDGSFNRMAGTDSRPVPAKRGSVLQLFGSAADFYMDEEHLRLVGDFVPTASGAPLYHTTISPEVRVGGVPAKVLFSGLAPGLKGVWQINLLVPEEVPAGNAPVEITFDGVKLTSISVAIE
jgi:uncharacterized protein (TIGR03437 family)